MGRIKVFFPDSFAMGPIPFPLVALRGNLYRNSVFFVFVFLFFGFFLGVFFGGLYFSRSDPMQSRE